jgi:outer membrane protein OmpA-like peptidoglycan-associated protein
MLLQVQFPTDLHGIHVVGFSDRIGTRRGNLRLSRQRAEAVRRYLIEGGVPASEVIAEGRGEAEPQVQCSETGRKALSACLAPNRRVEITGMMVVPSTP